MIIRGFTTNYHHARFQCSEMGIMTILAGPQYVFSAKWDVHVQISKLAPMVIRGYYQKLSDYPVLEEAEDPANCLLHLLATTTIA